MEKRYLTLQVNQSEDGELSMDIKSNMDNFQIMGMFTHLANQISASINEEVTTQKDKSYEKG